MASRKSLLNASSFEGASTLVGELAADGTASLQPDNLSLNGDTVTPESHSQASVGSSEDSIHGELDGLVPRSANEIASTLLRVDHFQDPKELHDNVDSENLRSRRRKSLAIRLEKTDQAGRYKLIAEDPELRSLLKQGFEMSKDGGIKKKRSRFSDLVFTRRFTAFDRQNVASASSPFHGFFSLFW